MYKIYLPTNEEFTRLLNWGSHYCFIFDWDPERHLISYTDNIEEADIIISQEDMRFEGLSNTVEKLDIKNKILVFLFLFHGQESHAHNVLHFDVRNRFLGRINPENIILATTNLFNIDNVVPGIVYYDMMMERQQVFFTQREKYEIKSHSRWMPYDTKSMFELDTLTKNESAKHFLAPMRIYDAADDPRSFMRQQLQDLLKQHSEKGYVSDHKNGVFLEAQHTSPDTEHWMTPEHLYGRGIWLPVHNKYYKDSIVSMYVETITHGSNYRFVTEKTFDPLIKGHFILPYGYKGLVKDILSYGFKLPDWIDYSYDDYYNDDLDVVCVSQQTYLDNFLKFSDHQTRWKKYSASVNKILAMSQKELYNLYLKDIDILEHNRALFFNRKRTSLLNIILEHVEKRKKGFN